MNNWAKNEIDLAKANITNTDDNNLMARCLTIAYSAYESIQANLPDKIELNIIRSIIDDMIDQVPLTPITSDDKFEVLNDSAFMCTRMPDLIKVIDGDKVSYTDIGRVTCFDLDNTGLGFNYQLANTIIDNIYPVTLPYCRENKFNMYIRQFLSDKDNGDFDYIGFYYFIDNYGRKTEVNKFFKEVNGQMVEIDEYDFIVDKKKLED